MQRSISADRLVQLVGSATQSGPAYRGLADGIRLAVADGRVPAGVRLPSERDLTRVLGVSRTTVTRAYGLLRDQGYLDARQGSGSIAVLPGGSRRPAALRPGGGGEEVIDLTIAALTAAPGFQAATERAVARLPRHLQGRGCGYHPLGLPELRERVAADFTARGLATRPDQVMITSGALAAFAATTRALIGPGDRVLMESPTYPNAIETVRRSGARPVALPLEESGWDLGALTATLRQTAPRGAYLIPDFQNPTGQLMSDDQRAQVARALRAAHTVPVIDETVAELALDEDPVRPFGAYAPRSVTIGGASKTYWGGLRIGWLRAPRDLFAPIADARLSLDLSAPVLDQLVQLELLELREDILASRRARLGASRDALMDALSDQLPDWSLNRPTGGLSLWVGLPEASSTALTVAAERHGVLLAPGPAFAVEGGLERFVRLPYADHPPEVLHEAVDRLARAWSDARSRPLGRRAAARLVS